MTEIDLCEVIRHIYFKIKLFCQFYVIQLGGVARPRQTFRM